eukprot:scaffold256433_cov21-Tisochrysis_lutea.AAC.1
MQGLLKGGLQNTAFGQIPASDQMFEFTLRGCVCRWMREAAHTTRLKAAQAGSGATWMTRRSQTR